MTSRAILFPGQGAQKVGMGKDLHDAYPAVRDLYDQAATLVDFDLRRCSFEGPEEELRRTDVSQPAIVVASLAALRALESELGGPIPGVAASCGMSLGEYTALTYASALSLGDALRLVALRGRFMQECCEQTPGSMTSVLGLGVEAVRQVIADSGESAWVGVANDNSPGQVVISGEKAALARVAERCKAAGAKRLFPLSVAGAYHSRLMAPAGERLRAELAKVSFHEPRLTVLANVDGAPHKVGDVAERLVRQVSGTVRWRESMSALAALGIGATVELGPGGVLKGLQKQNVGALPCESAMTSGEVKAAAAALRA